MSSSRIVSIDGELEERQEQAHRSAEGITTGLKKVPEEPKLTRIPIKSFHGQRKFYCKQCAEFVFVAFLIKGKIPHPDFEDETIIVDVLEGDCGHEIANYSH